MLDDNVLKELNNEFTMMFWRHHKDIFLEDVLNLSVLLKGYNSESHHMDFARRYELGLWEGFEQSYRKALSHYLEAARLGNSEANLKVALFYLYGYGVEKSNRELFEKYIRIAVQSGSIVARRYFNVWNNSEKFVGRKTYFPVQR